MSLKSNERKLQGKGIAAERTLLSSKTHDKPVNEAFSYLSAGS